MLGTEHVPGRGRPPVYGTPSSRLATRQWEVRPRPGGLLRPEMVVLLGGGAWRIPGLRRSGKPRRDFLPTRSVRPGSHRRLRPCRRGSRAGGCSATARSRRWSQSYLGCAYNPTRLQTARDAPVVIHASGDVLIGPSGQLPYSYWVPTRRYPGPTFSRALVSSAPTVHLRLPLGWGVAGITP